ncbi:bifunctional 4-hydroxy-2-oxoglutarate aldolase/2-dehydro-3-deoxy-phosphogluconate aldolase [Leeia sp. TBRC 13508]|uniref:2-dehydro-3-deoxy-phosphogluconate aldolase n=1 Tax=Leeia speluncae TaxID=2884804 RepID=A0ABS8DAQ2_9NEIS|nr:bifunctional 4-hydroxy-2-oxoglutarate aldolase/2-dehydro-3-deoxy-phosphogluconate aldolase [Leeia speluncae]MCB6185289.1 bifunctional 4-hydroxy-2-oxoglutarate aldolase/2-dehydro-3-deoxy-phosphogluconate aldolase [Leeia speluncae]
MTLDQIIAATTVMPVIVIDDLDTAVPLAQALVAGGIRTLEVTLRTPKALEAIKLIKAEVPDAILGAGTITTASQLDAVIEAGASFGVSPGSTPAFLESIKKSGLPFLPGVMTPSEAMVARDAGFAVLKLFPAVPAGGVKLLEAIRGPLPEIKFCPTGGISPQTAPDFLKLPNVVCIGGSWLTPKEAIASKNWDEITRLAKEAASLRG